MEKDRWKVYKSLYSTQWLAWHTGWDLLNGPQTPLRFATWQDAIIYVNRMVGTNVR